MIRYSSSRSKTAILKSRVKIRIQKSLVYPKSDHKMTRTHPGGWSRVDYKVSPSPNTRSFQFLPHPLGIYCSDQLVKIKNLTKICPYVNVQPSIMFGYLKNVSSSGSPIFFNVQSTTISCFFLVQPVYLCWTR